jgi:hypothetical protein
VYLCQPSFVPGPQTWDPGGGMSKLSRFVDDDVQKLIDKADIEWE